MKRITRDIDPDNAHDLLERVPRACIAFAYEHEPQAQPVHVVWQVHHYFIGIPDGVVPLPEMDQEVVLLVDEGIYFFDLRAIYIRGHLQSTLPPPNVSNKTLWFELIPTKEIAWDYGTLHEVNDESV